MFVEKYKLRDFGEAKYILGWHIRKNRDKREIMIHQQQYAEKVISKFDIGPNEKI